MRNNLDLIVLWFHGKQQLLQLFLTGTLVLEVPLQVLMSTGIALALEVEALEKE